MKSNRASAIARILLGLVFVVFGLNGFLHFIPSPPPPASAAAFIGGLFSAAYMLPLIKGVEVVAGALLLGNRFVPLSLALLAPNVVNIVLFHVFLAPAGIVLALMVLALELYLAWSYRDAYRPMLAARVQPAKAGRSTDAAPGSSVHAPV
ncbi:MAG TPA: DoxX family protein [Polyangiaceae bacterium]|jgi:uncharacterized membrane protein YphA (DoxX/SURF4 family)|nr:DoxX family protein [Polyangiaceae bacterium]